MLRLEDVSKKYSKRRQTVVALQACNMEIGQGEFVAVIGHSGSGKSTLLSIMGGMLAPSSGQMWLEGQSLYELTVTQRTVLRRKKIGFVFQTFNLVPYLNAVENVQIPLFLTGHSPTDQRRRAIDLLTQMGLEDRLDHKPSELSVGQQQRVALARTLANDPTLILADEPTGNLDPETSQQIIKFLEECNEKEGRTIVMVTHDPRAAKRAKRSIRLQNGVITPQSFGDEKTNVA